MSPGSKTSRPRAVRGDARTAEDVPARAIPRARAGTRPSKAVKARRARWEQVKRITGPHPVKVFEARPRGPVWHGTERRALYEMTAAERDTPLERRRRRDSTRAKRARRDRAATTTP